MALPRLSCMGAPALGLPCRLVEITLSVLGIVYSPLFFCFHVIDLIKGSRVYGKARNLASAHLDWALAEHRGVAGLLDGDACVLFSGRGCTGSRNRVHGALKHSASYATLIVRER